MQTPTIFLLRGLIVVQGQVNMYYDSGSPGQGYADVRSYTNWPNPDTNLNADLAKKYSINCTYYTCKPIHGPSGVNWNFGSISIGYS